MTSRSFNTLNYNELLGTITKKSENTEKFISEINWYLQAPEKIHALTPKLISYSEQEPPFIELEYYGYPPLSELWVHGNLGFKTWKSIIDKLMMIFDLFRDYPENVSRSDYISAYWTKTIDRLEMASKSNPDLMKLCSSPSLIINGRVCKSFHYLKSDLREKIDNLYDKKDNVFIHGDMCFSNILYDLNNGIIRLIDPRGVWGNCAKGGDLKYDLAKLRHSIAGYYDFIVGGYYNFSQNDDRISFSFLNVSELHHCVIDYFDGILRNQGILEKISLIESLLFLSMIPLHSENLERQKILYATGLEKLNIILS